MLSFHVKFVQTDTDRRTYNWMDRRTMVKQYAPNLSMQGHKNVAARLRDELGTPTMPVLSQLVMGSCMARW